MTNERKRKGDTMIDKIDEKVDRILCILNGNGKIGLVAQTEINKTAIEALNARPSNIKNWVIALAIIINTAVGIGALVIKL